MKIGLLGCGRAAEIHMAAFNHLDASVVAAYDIDSERAAEFSQRHNIPRVSTNYMDLLETKGLDLVDICTPPSTHTSFAAAAAEAGLDILLEKPMALTTSECDEIIHRTAKHGVKICVCHNQIFFPAIKRALSLVLSGQYDLTSFRTSVKENPTLIGAPAWNLSNDEKGMIWDSGCHHAYLHLNFLREITEVYAVGSTVNHPVIDNYAVLLRTSGKTCGIMEMSWLSKVVEAEYEISSSDGRRLIIDRHHDLVTELPESSHSSSFSEFKNLLNLIPKGLGYCIGHYFLIREYFKSVKKDESPPVDPAEGKNAIRLLESIDESLKTGRPVKFH